MKKCSDHEYQVPKLADEGKLPTIIIDDSIAPLTVFRRLHECGCLNGAPVSDHRDKCIQFFDPEITSLGAMRLAELNAGRPTAHFGQNVSKVGAGIINLVIAPLIVGLIVAWLIKHFNLTS